MPSSTVAIGARGMPIKRLKRLASWRPGRLAWNTAHAGGWNAVRVLLQAGSLVLMARVFGADGYGVLAGTMALYMTCAQFAGLGSGTALVRHLARDGDLHGKFLTTQRIYAITGFALLALVWPASVWLFGATLPPLTMALLGAAELIVAPALMPLAYRFLADERLSVSGALLTVAPGARFAAIGITAALGFRSVSAFAWFYLGCLIIAVGATIRRFWPRKRGLANHHTMVDTIREGLPFVISGVAVTAGGELDKTVMLRLTGPLVTGQYAAAYRIMQAATLPINSLVLAAAPRMFRAQIQSTGLFAKLLLAAFLYALGASFLLLLLSPFAHVLLGRDFLPSESILRWLCLALVTGCLRQVVTSQLTTANLQASRNMIEISSLCVFLFLLFWLVQTWGAFGAVIALTVSDLAVVILGVTRMFRTTGLTDDTGAHGQP